MGMGMHRELWDMMEELKTFATAFELQSLYAVKQFLERFGWNGDATALMQELLDGIENERRVHAESMTTTNSKYEEKKRKMAAMEEGPDPGRPRVVVGFCPRCGDKMVGEPVNECQSKRKRRRSFYKECTTCPYYAEVWVHKNKHYETEEGG